MNIRWDYLTAVSIALAIFNPIRHEQEFRLKFSYKEVMINFDAYVILDKNTLRFSEVNLDSLFMLADIDRISIILRKTNPNYASDKYGYSILIERDELVHILIEQKASGLAFTHSMPSERIFYL